MDKKLRKKIRSYSKVLKEDQDWDWCFVINLLRHKILRMSKQDYYSKDIKDDMKLAIKLMDSIETSALEGHYVNTKNWSRFLELDLQNNQFGKSLLREEKIWNCLWTLIKYKLREWWD